MANEDTTFSAYVAAERTELESGRMTPAQALGGAQAPESQLRRHQLLIRALGQRGRRRGLGTVLSAMRRAKRAMAQVQTTQTSQRALLPLLVATMQSKHAAVCYLRQCRCVTRSYPPTSCVRGRSSRWSRRKLDSARRST
jgi:hypothetical protein